MIKLLLDANLSYRLVKKLETKYPETIHVSKTGLLQPAQDIDIWNWAKENKYTIVTNDSDFENFANLFGTPPKIVLLKVGNQSTKHIAILLLDHYEDIDQLIKSDELGFWVFSFKFLYKAV